MASERSRATYLTVGQQFNLEHACRMLSAAFGLRTYLVGSALNRPDYRDVDLRCLLADEEYDVVIGTNTHRLKLLKTALSEWLASRTGLLVDFQFQRVSDANAEFEGVRHPFGFPIQVDPDGD